MTPVLSTLGRCAFAFNIIVYALVRRHSRERRVSRTTSLYLLGFVVVWFPSLLRRLQVCAKPVRQGRAPRPCGKAVRQARAPRPCAKAVRQGRAARPVRGR